MSTTAQDDAAARACDILGEHFSAYVVIAREDDEVNNRFQQIRVCYDGGFYNALGMLTYAQENADKLLDEGEDNDDDDLLGA